MHDVQIIRPNASYGAKLNVRPNLFIRETRYHTAKNETHALKKAKK